MEIITTNLNRLMVNKKGPSEKKERLYKNVANSVVLYGAPVWAEEVTEFPNIAKKIRAVQSKISLRVIRAYRIVSGELAMVLAGNLTVELRAEKMRAVYQRKKMAVDRNAQITEKGLALIRRQEQDKMIIKWRARLMELADMGRGFNLEVLSCFGEWVGRNHVELTYQATQLITGHGCFRGYRGYTHTIGKADSDRCSLCGTAGEDNVHVLVECEEWRKERDRLTRAYGRQVRSLGAMMRRMVANPLKWKTALEFAKEVMDRKEVMERQKQTDDRRNKVILEARRMLKDWRGGAMQSAGTSAAGISDCTL